MKINFKRISPTLAWAWLIAATFCRCTFHPHDEYISSIKPPEPILVSFIINDPGFKDPYYLIETTGFYFRLKELDNAIVSNEIKLDGSLINSTITNNSVNFMLDPNALRIGSHTIDMTFYVDTKSGSLANKVGAEFYVVEQSFKVIIDPTPPEFSSFRAGIENGYLTFRWNGPRAKDNFIYEIIRSNSSVWYYSDSLIYDSQADHFIDPGYVGGHLNYKVAAKGFGFEIVVGLGEIYHEPVDFKLTKDTEGIVRLTWSESDMNTENVQMSILSPPFMDGEKTFPFTSSGDIVIGKPGFADGLNVFVDLYRSGYSSQRARFSIVQPSTPNLKPFKAYAMLKQSNKLLISTEDKIYRYDLEGVVLEDSLSLPDNGMGYSFSLAVSPDESRAFVSGMSGSFLSFNPMHFDNVNHHDIEAVTGKFADPNIPLGYLRLGNASDNGLLSFAFWRGDRYLMVLDVDSGEELWHSPPGNDFVPIISNDGKYVAVDIGVPYANHEGWILKRENGHFYPLGKIDPGDHVFLAGGGEVLSSTRINELTEFPEYNYIRVFNLVDPPQDSNNLFSRIRSIPIPEKSGLNDITYDPYTNYLGFRYYENIDLINAATMQLEKSLSGPSLLFSNNYILTPSGFIASAP